MNVYRRLDFLCLCWVALSAVSLAVAEENQEVPVKQNAEQVSSIDEKNPEDPTKIVTRIGAGYNGDFTLNGSIGLDEARMLSGFINSDASEWRIGGSWLFEKGIVNFNFKKTQYESGGQGTSYNVGTFVPLRVFGIEPNGWQIFPTLGLNYTRGEILALADPSDATSQFLLPVNSTGAYLGGFALKPLNDQWTTMGGFGGSYGSDSTTNVYGGLGLSYRLTKAQSCNIFLSASNSSQFGTNETLAVNYRYEF